MPSYPGMAEPLGALIAFLCLKPFINDLILGIIFAVVCGIMLYISLAELIPSSQKYGYSKIALISTFLGFCMMPLTHILHQFNIILNNFNFFIKIII